MNLSKAFRRNFLGNSPRWYKSAIFAFLIINPIVLLTLGETVASWLLIIEFIFTLAMALKCYPLQPGGLLAIEAVILGLTSPDAISHEIVKSFEVILLLMFMVAGIYFMKDLLLFTFTKILLKCRSKRLLSVLFCAVSAFLSAFLDALTVTAVIISVCVGFYSVYHRVVSGSTGAHEIGSDGELADQAQEDLEGFRAFLRSLLMHSAVGTALGGVCTTVGEPQNLLIANIAGWDFATFFMHMAPITMPVLATGLTLCLLLETFKIFGYGAPLEDSIRKILTEFDEEETRNRSTKDVAALITQACCAVFLMVGLALHLADVGLIGLTIIILQTAFNGITDEHRIGKAFEEALPFTALLVVFFCIVAVIHEHHLFTPVVDFVLSRPVDAQPTLFFIANGVLSAISDNVFVATIYISEVETALNAGEITREHFDALTVAINTGTNIPSIATPNGQAAFLFLLTSSIAPLVRLSYGKMVLMALPYTLALSAVGLTALSYTY